MKTRYKIVIGVVLTFFLGYALVFANALFGNPVSKYIASKALDEYMSEQYKGTDYVVERVYYSFKINSYEGHIVSPSSIDTHFNVRISKSGEIEYDGYEDYVLDHFNTFERIDLEYRDLTDTVFKAENFPLESHIDYGRIMEKHGVVYDSSVDQVIEKNSEVDSIYDEGVYGIERHTLELDKVYDIRELGKKHGELVFYCYAENPSYEIVAERLLLLKELFDKADVPFYCIDFVLALPKEENADYTREELEERYHREISLANFLYEDIYEEGLVERVEENYKALMKYYEKMYAE